MRCNNCGTEFSIGEICPNCGTIVTNPPPVKNAGSKGSVSGKSVFIEPSEYQLGIIGQGYLDSFLRMGVISKGYGIISNKRFYFNGECYGSNVGGGLMKSKENWTVDLSDITSTGFRYKSSLALIVSAVIWGFLAVVSGVAAKSFGVFMVLAIISAVSVLLFFLTKRLYYIVTFAGGSIMINVTPYGEENCKAFDKTLRISKDSYIRALKRM